jgi:transposase
MGRPYSQDLRDRVLRAVDEGNPVYELADVLGVSVSYIYKALIRRRTTGETSARLLGRGPKPKLAVHDEALREKIQATPDATLAELQAWLLDERAIKVSTGCLSNRLQHLGLTRKKSRSTLPSRNAQTLPRRVATGSPARAI